MFRCGCTEEEKKINYEGKIKGEGAKEIEGEKKGAWGGRRKEGRKKKTPKNIYIPSGVEKKEINKNAI